METLSLSQLQNQLNQFTGTEQWVRYSPLFPKVMLTDGTLFLAENCGAYWLMDAIASHIPAVAKAGEYVAFAKLVVNEDQSATLTLQDDEPAEKIYAQQEFEYVDFPLPEILLYIGLDAPNSQVICLVSEH